jgi:hypothetical protein
VSLPTHTFDRHIEIATASDSILDRELEMTLDYIKRSSYSASVDPRMPTVRAILREQETRKERRRQW